MRVVHRFRDDSTNERSVSTCGLLIRATPSDRFQWEWGKVTCRQCLRVRPKPTGSSGFYAWESGPVNLEVWKMLQTFDHPTYTDGTDIRVGDLVEWGNAPDPANNVYMVLAVRCEQAPVAECATVVIGNPEDTSDVDVVYADGEVRVDGGAFSVGPDVAHEIRFVGRPVTAMRPELEARGAGA